MPALDIYQELRALAAALQQEGIDYALCGAIALAIHAQPRATKDIDLLIQPADLQRLNRVVRGLGFTLQAAPMQFASGVVMHRLSKVAPDEVLTIDMLLADAVLDECWQSRQCLDWNGLPLWVVSRTGLAAMKRLAGRAQDIADLEQLGELDDEAE